LELPIPKRLGTELVRLTSMGKKFREKRGFIGLKAATQRVQSILSYSTKTKENVKLA
jgi:hypothetical protein